MTATRFFIALLPPQHVQDYATAVIQELRDRHHTRTANAPPHITLQPPFEWPLDAIRVSHGQVSAPLTQCLENFAQTRLPIPVTLQNFNAFTPRVLYLDVVKSAELMTLQRELMAELETSLGIVDAQSKRRGFSPHLTVASRNMTPTVFQAAWAELRDRQVTFEFVCDHLTLLIHDGQQWQTHSTFAL